MVVLLEEERLKDLLSKREYTRLDKILFCLAVNDTTPKQVKEVRELAVTSGLRAASKWNISQLLGDADELVVRVTDGWELTLEGRKRIREIAGPYASSSVPLVASNLRQYLPNISDEQTKSFIEEAIECFEVQLFRAAVVLSWVGAVSMLQKHVALNHLKSFNNEAQRRNAKWKFAKNADDIGRMKESELLNVLETLSIIGKNVKQELEGCLKLRNGCGHPNSLQIGESRVSAHIEILILNVFSKFS